MKDGLYYKEIGDDRGVVLYRGHWVRFLCMGCAYAMGVLRERHQGPMTPSMEKASKNPVELFGHDAKLHRAWIEAGKPTLFTASDK